MNQHELGRYGENRARQILEEKGYTILHSNYRFGKLELDLVCSFENHLVVVEVKTRFTDAYGEPWQSVTKAKQRQIIRATNFYIEEFGVQQHTRFDVISIIHNEQFERIEHIEDAFVP